MARADPAVCILHENAIQMDVLVLFHPVYFKEASSLTHHS